MISLRSINLINIITAIGIVVLVILAMKIMGFTFNKTVEGLEGEKKTKTKEELEQEQKQIEENLAKLDEQIEKQKKKNKEIEDAINNPNNEMVGALKPYEKKVKELKKLKMEQFKNETIGMFDFGFAWSGFDLDNLIEMMKKEGMSDFEIFKWLDYSINNPSLLYGKTSSSSDTESVGNMFGG